MRVLAVQLKRIGDLVLTLPALAALKAAGAHVTLALAESTAPLLPAIAQLADEPVVHRKVFSNAPFWRSILRGGFDRTIDFTGNDRSALATLCSRAKSRVAASHVLRGAGWRRFCYTSFIDSSVRGRHTADHYLDLTGLPPDPSARLLQLPENPISSGLERGCVVVHAGSARPEKYWLAERWAEVIDHCQRELGLHCVLTGGRNDPYETAHLAAIRAAVQTPLTDLSGKLDLLQLAALLARATFFVGVDSGPMHLAATLGVPSVVLFGPTNPFHWRPKNGLSLVLQPGNKTPVESFRADAPGGAMAGISTHAVIGCIERLARAKIDPLEAK